jgi:hypothetical protein
MSKLEEPRAVVLSLCGLCLHGAGGECHTPGCALWMNRAPDAPIDAVEMHDLRGAVDAVPAQPSTEFALGAVPGPGGRPRSEHHQR